MKADTRKRLELSEGVRSSPPLKAPPRGREVSQREGLRRPKSSLSSGNVEGGKNLLMEKKKK